jgi:hypothetical protein
MASLANHLYKLFADDTKLIAVIREQSDFTVLQHNIDQLVEWARTWRMSFNEEKCNIFYTIQLSQKKFGYPYRVKNCKLVWTKQILDLGILINHKLKWHDQVTSAKNKAYAAIGTLKRTFKY